MRGLPALPYHYRSKSTKKNKVVAGEDGDGDIFRHIHTNIFRDSSQSRQRGGEGLFVYCRQPDIFYCRGKEEDYISNHGPWTILHKILLVKYDTYPNPSSSCLYIDFCFPHIALTDGQLDIPENRQGHQQFSTSYLCHQNQRSMGLCHNIFLLCFFSHLCPDQFPDSCHFENASNLA
jgi:hypothetical protein